MPELPEVETVCRGLRAQLPGETVKGVEVFRDASIAFPDVAEFCRRLCGHQFVTARRRGKYILIELDGDAGLAVHLRMSGRLLVTEAKSPAGQFLRVKLSLVSGREIRFEDMRVFGRLWYKPAAKSFEEVIPHLAALGVEPLAGLDANLLGELLDKRQQAIKSALMDQRLIAGIGNIYADEALFRAGIHPQRQAGQLSSSELETLVLEIKNVLDKAIKYRGSTLRDYTDSEGVNGDYQNQAWVYGRTGKKCRTCKSLIQRVKIAGRSSHFCLSCQPEKKSRKKTTKKTR